LPQIDAISETDALTQTDALKKALAETDIPLYAVLDGAQFEDLPGLLFDHDFP